jgi:8-oxo-dGTP pyrophosphatase MutT (NUDIX family)
MENKELNFIINNISDITIANAKNKKKFCKKKIFKSASLIFYSKELGYLFCEEFRYKEKKILIHPIGGKVENYDIDIFSTAVREFIEEVNLEFHPIINKENNIKSKLITNISENLKKISSYRDLCIHKKNKYFHRFYIVSIDNIENDKFKKNIIELPNYFNDNYKTEINKINWYKISCVDDVFWKNISWLTKMFVNFFFKNI